MLLGILAANSLGNLLTDKEVKAEILGRWLIRAGDRATATSQTHWSKPGFLMLSHLLINFEIQ